MEKVPQFFRAPKIPSSITRMYLRQGQYGQLPEAAVHLVGGEDIVVRDLLVVDVQQAPVLQPEDGVRPPVLAVDRVAVLADRQRRDALEQETR